VSEPSLPAFDRRLTPARPDLAAAFLRGKIEAARYAQGQLMHVIAEVTDLRPQPSPEASLDTQALYGEEAVIYDADEGWAWGQLANDGYVGYLPASALAEGPQAATHRLAVLRSFIYPGASLKLPIQGALTLNARMNVVAADGDFLRLAEGGYVFASHAVARDAYEPDFVAVAERFLNVPYLWGGRSALGIDCSGLVQVSLAAAGQRAPRDTDLQEKQLGDSVALSDAPSGLQRGDLIFWKGHVGMMRDTRMLLHANAFHMQVASEPLAEAVARIQARAGAVITSIRRLSGSKG
jgi:cell wall-associated NlpC family hydrolase